MLRVRSAYVRRRGSTGLTSALKTWPALVMIGDSTRGITIFICGAMQERVVGLPADPGPVHLDAGLVGLPPLGCGLALLRLVLSRPVQTQRASLDLCDDGGPFLGSLRTELVTSREPALVPCLPFGILARVVFGACWTLGRGR